MMFVLLVFVDHFVRMFEFKTQKGARRFIFIFSTTSILLLFSRPIWDIFLRPVYQSYITYEAG